MSANKASYFSTKLVMIAVVGVIFFIASFWLDHSTIKERQSLLHKAKENIALSWSGSQNLLGPLLIVPYVDHSKKDESAHGHLIFFPKILKVTGEATPEIRKRGIFGVLVYESKLNLDCKFASFKNYNDKSKTFSWNQARVVVCLSDARGLNAASIKINGKEANVLAGSDALNKKYPGIHAVIGPEHGETLHIETNISFRGSETLNIVPIAKENQIALQASWGSPSFIGHFLPTKKTITDNEFQAQWDILSLATSLPDCLDLKDIERKDKILSKAVGVEFLDVNDHYKQAERATKYSFLFVLYTFLLFFLFEVIKKTKIHIFQYCITACSFLCFSLLLTAFAEHISFNIAYWIAAILIIGQITFYVTDLLKKVKERLMFFSFLVILYAYLFIVMRLEDFALLVGSLGMFALISVAMFLTKKIDWFAEE